jgi:hypothetical protein
MKIENLLKTNVNDHVEKKNNLSYLSWAWAWAEALKADQKATFKVEMFGDKCFMDINGTAMVWVTVTIFDKPMTCQLPVMDYKNKAIPNPDAFAVNKAIMRCMTKALSLHGLGLYIYAGEDLPEKEQLAVKQISEQDLNLALNSVGHAQTLDDLKNVYTEAIKFCGSDDAAKAHVIAVKNQRKEELSA